MPHQLRKAHQELDKAVDKLYRPTPFTGDRDRVEHLFGIYERHVAPLQQPQVDDESAGPTRESDSFFWATESPRGEPSTTEA